MFKCFVHFEVSVDYAALGKVDTCPTIPTLSEEDVFEVFGDVFDDHGLTPTSSNTKVTETASSGFVF